MDDRAIHADLLSSENLHIKYHIPMLFAHGSRGGNFSIIVKPLNFQPPHTRVNNMKVAKTLVYLTLIGHGNQCD